MYKHNFVKVGMVVPNIKLGDAYSNALEIIKIIEKDEYNAILLFPELRHGFRSRHCRFRLQFLVKLHVFPLQSWNPIKEQALWQDDIVLSFLQVSDNAARQALRLVPSKPPVCHWRQLLTTPEKK